MFAAAQLLLIAGVLAGAPPERATAPPPLQPAAKALLDAGMKLYSQERYADALVRFEKGWARQAHPDFLYAMGQAERMRGNCEKAIEHYGAYVLQARSETQVTAARVQISRCEDLLRQRKESAAREAQEARVEQEAKRVEDARRAELERLAREAAARPPSVEPPPPAVIAPSPWYTDALGDTLAIVSVVAMATGTVLAVQSERTLARQQDSYEAYLSAQGALSTRAVGWSVAGAGAAVGVGALLRYATRASAAPAVALIPGSTTTLSLTLPWP